MEQTCLDYEPRSKSRKELQRFLCVGVLLLLLLCLFACFWCSCCCCCCLDFFSKKYHQVNFLQPSIYCQIWSLPISVVYIPSETSLKTTKFSFANGHQLKIVSWLGMGAPVHFLLSVLGHCLDPASLGPLCAASISGRSQVPQFCCIQNTEFP